MPDRDRYRTRQESWETGVSEDPYPPERERHRRRDRQASEEASDPGREDRRRRRKRERQDSGAPKSRDDRRGRDRDRDTHPREPRDGRGGRDGRDRKRPNRQFTQETFLTPGLYDLSETISTAYSPFADPMGLSASPPASEQDSRNPPLRIKSIDRVDGGLYITDPDLELGGDHDTSKQEASGEGKPGNTEVSKLERWLGPLVYTLPVLTAIGLLFAATCSADGWRVKVNVLRVDLPNDVFARLLATGENLGKSGSESESGTVDSGTGGSGGKSTGLGTGTGSGRTMESRAGKVVAAGYISVGFWGWCISRPDQSEYACSPTNAWYTMEDLLETAEVTSSIPSRAFHDGLIHGLVVYGPAMVSAMVAAVPAGIHIYRRLIKNNRVIEAGIVLHASLFCGGTFSFIAFMVSKALEMRLNSKLKFDVIPGLLPTMAGIASLLLFLALGASSVPVIYRRVKRQQDILGSWDDVQAAQPTPLPVLTPASLGRSFSLKRNKTWKRMTGYWGSKSKSKGKRNRRGGRGRRRH